MKILLIGDMHVTVEELADSQALMNGVLGLVDEHDPDAVVFLGDQHHNHAIVRVEVTDFWLKNLKRLNGLNGPPYLILGNHDRPNDAATSAHALQPYQHLAHVVDRPHLLHPDGIWLLPYFHDREAMAKEAQSLTPKKAAVCHQTFDGSKYENGFYAPDGIDPALVGFPFVISGHIHTMQEVHWSGGLVRYIGSPRWRTLSDANVSKCVALWDTDTNETALFDTSEWCSPISESTVDNSTDLTKVPFAQNPTTRHHFDAVAPKVEIDELVGKLKLTFPRCRVRPFPTDTSGPRNKVSETEGVFNALRRFIDTYKPPHGTDPTLLRKLIAERLHVNN